MYLLSRVFGGLTLVMYVAAARVVQDADEVRVSRLELVPRVVPALILGADHRRAEPARCHREDHGRHQARPPRGAVGV